MGSNDGARLDVRMVRETYTGILYAAGLPEATELGNSLGRLRGHILLLVPEVMALAARMRGMTRCTAVHCLVWAYQLMEEEDDNPAAPEIRLQDLAIVARALLALYEHPGPLGSPYRAGEIEATVRRRMCGMCMQSIEEGEPFERAVFMSEASGGIRGYRHTGACAVLTEVVRAQLRAVP
ncbi:hypothetical protein LK07_18275 [Streptomyces pluripotens]|uniref:Uncharacterized protein n=1 Tax=Streptomyces pluripotens TaxID=1355015 RepID=A0A221P046_9ACTN|nr:DUF6415 family natural product biosynthesis protein [Streptomyces pluripotens]ARP71391.1 hypothetical protein LK06_017120 [Streptomyces pluripotens]ASN25643.1 hypothetical protein LK07_18275 [Streptomyces pluripotens]